MRWLGIFCVLIGLSFAAEARSEGAIVWSTDRNGWHAANIVSNYRTAKLAISDALKLCMDKGFNGCEIKKTFNRACAGIAYSPQNAVSWWVAKTADAASRAAIDHCNKQYGSCVAGPTLCDTMAPMTFACLDPIFEERLKLLEQVERNPNLEDWTVQAVRYLEGQYCAYVPGAMAEDREREFFNSHCYVSTGMYRGERVYWEGCNAYE